jgi:hypothetical protein
LRAALNIIVVLRGVVSQARRLVFVRRSLGCAARMGNTLVRKFYYRGNIDKSTLP